MNNCSLCFNLRYCDGRIPTQARGFMDTEEMVQDTMMLAFKNFKNIKANRPSAFLTYLRTIFIYQINKS